MTNQPRLFSADKKVAVELPKPKPKAEQQLFPHVPNCDIHLHSASEAVANIQGLDPDRTLIWLTKIVSSFRELKSRRIAFPVKDLDKFLELVPPVNVTIDAACLAVARAIWASKLGWKPLKVTRHRQRLLANSLRWPPGWKIEDAPWTAIAAISYLKLDLNIDPKARLLMVDKLGQANQVIANAGLSGSAILLETEQPSLLESLKLPGLAYMGGQGSGKYRLPLLAAEALLNQPGIKLTSDAKSAIKKASAKARAVVMDKEFPWTLYPFQARDVSQAVKIVETTGGTLLAGDMGSGKQLSNSEPILTPTGWVKMGDIKIGNSIIGTDGKSHTVKGVYPQGMSKLFKATFSDGSYSICSDDHLWAVNTAVRNKRGNPHQVKTLNEIRHSLRDGAGNCKHFLPTIQPVQYAQQSEPLPINPYILGLLLGDGALHGTLQFTTADLFTLRYIKKHLPEDMYIEKDESRRYNYYLKSRVPKQTSTYKAALKGLGLWGMRAWDKFVPEVYLRASVEERLEVLRGLLDTDGGVASWKTTSSTDYTTSSERLADGMAELVQSLGGIARRSEKQFKTHTHKGKKLVSKRGCYRFSIVLPKEMNPFKLPRKADLFVPRVKYQPVKCFVSVEPVEDDYATCISVDSPDNLYLTRAFSPTHNTTVSLAVASKENLWPLLVVCPLAAISTWDRQLTQMGKTFLRAEGKIPEMQELMLNNHYDAVMITFDRLHQFVDTIEHMNFAAIIADEVQRIRTPSSRRSRALRRLASSVPVRIGLSGTPITNKVDDILPLGAFLAPGEWPPRASAKDLEDLYPGDAIESVAEHLSTLMVRRRMEDTGVKLPGRTVKRVFVPLTPDQRKALDDLEAEAQAAKEEGELSNHLHVFARLQKMRQIVNVPAVAGLQTVNPKLQAAVDIAQEFAARGEKSIIFVADRPAWIEAGQMLKKVGLNWTGIWGSTAIPDRIKNEHTYHNDPDTMVFIGTLASCAESLTLSPTARCTIFAALSYSPSTLDQAAARAYRMNTTHPVTEIYLSAQGPSGTLDDRIWELVQNKKALFAQVVDRTKYSDPAERVTLGDLVYLLTGERDESIDMRAKDAQEEEQRYLKKKQHARASAHKHKTKEFIDDGTMATILNDTDEEDLLVASLEDSDDVDDFDMEEDED